MNESGKQPSDAQKDTNDSILFEKRRERNVKYLQHMLKVLPSSVISLDCSKVLLTYFAVSGLDVLDRLDRLPHDRKTLIDWIYNHQLKQSLQTNDPTGVCGFRGSTNLITQHDKSIQSHEYDCAHVTMTFSALNCLLTLEDDLSRLNKKAIINGLRKMQLHDGSFTATNQDNENDVRFLYSACCICYILNDWSAMDKDRAFNFLTNCLTYEGAFGQNPEAEAHGGSTFCAVASLFLMDKLTCLSERELDRLKVWCLNRQTFGFSGRVNKPWDTCYSFWIGSTLKILDMLQYTSLNENVNYIFETYNEITGGFSKWPACSSDPLHTFMALCGLSLLDYVQLKPIHPALVISQRAHSHLKNLHRTWEQA